MNPKTPEISGDGLLTPVVGSWAEEKYQLLRAYATMFATSMKAKWDKRVYIDLFAGPGKTQIRGTSRIVLASPLVALDIPDPFDYYIFCEKNSDLLGALQERVKVAYPSKNVRFLLGDANDLVEAIFHSMPTWSRSKKVLAFCFGDPYRLRDLRFSTMRSLATRYMDFLVLLPTGMDAARNLRQYLKPGNATIDDFVGTSDWRQGWEKARASRTRFDVFLADFYWEQMKEMGYRYGGTGSSVLVRSTDRNLPLYRLGFFSRHPLGHKFWQEAKKYSHPQRPLFD